MEKFTVLDGLVAPMDKANVDTDAIIPKQFLKSIRRTGFGPNLFDAWRYLDEGRPDKPNAGRPLNSVHDDEKPRLVADLGDKSSLILRNHGLLTVGETVAEAFVNMYYLETSCAIQVRAQSGGGELIPVPKEVIDDSYARMQSADRPGGTRGGLVWPGLLRRLDRIDPSFRS